MLKLVTSSPNRKIIKQQIGSYNSFELLDRFRMENTTVTETYDDTLTNVSCDSVFGESTDETDRTPVPVRKSIIAPSTVPRLMLPPTSKGSQSTISATNRSQAGTFSSEGSAASLGISSLIDDLAGRAVQYSPWSRRLIFGLLLVFCAVTGTVLAVSTLQVSTIDELQAHFLVLAASGVIFSVGALPYANVVINNAINCLALLILNWLAFSQLRVPIAVQFSVGSYIAALCSAPVSGKPLILGLFVVTGTLIGLIVRLPLLPDRDDCATLVMAAAVLATSFLLFVRGRRLWCTLDQLARSLCIFHGDWLRDFRDQSKSKLDLLPAIAKPDMPAAQQVQCVQQMLTELVRNTTDKRQLKILKICLLRVDRPTVNNEAASFVNRWAGVDTDLTVDSMGRSDEPRSISRQLALDIDPRFTAKVAHGVTSTMSDPSSFSDTNDRFPTPNQVTLSLHPARGQSSSPDPTPDLEAVIGELLGGIREWEVDTLRYDAELGGRVLNVIMCAAFDYFSFGDIFNIPMVTLQLLLSELQRVFQPNPYHNSAHAALIVHSAFWLVTSSTVCRALSDLDIMALLFAAAIHDLGHPGVSNAFLGQTEAALAVRFNNTLPNEMHALATFFEFIARPELDLFCNLPAAQRRQLRDTIVTLVLAASSSRHFDLVTKLNERCDEGAFGGQTVAFEDRLTLLKGILRYSMLSSNYMSPPIYRGWTERVLEEMLVQGDLEARLDIIISPYSDRARPDPDGCQNTFFEYLAAPLHETMARILPEVAPHAEHLAANMAMWRQPEMIHTAIDRAKEPRSAIYPKGRVPVAELLARLDIADRTDSRADTTPVVIRQRGALTGEPSVGTLISPIAEGSESEGYVSDGGDSETRYSSNSM